MHRPLISTNLAISADGKISSSPPRPSGWTSSRDHQRLLDLRQNADAIMVGRGTLEADRMTMVVPERRIQPLRCVISHGGKFDFQHPIFHRPGGHIHLLVTGETVPESDASPSYSLHHGTILEFLENLTTRLDVARLHCEGGGQLIKALAQLDIIDEYHITLAGHTVFGGLSSATSTGIPEDYLPMSLGFEVVDFQPILETGECFLSYRRSR